MNCSNSFALRFVVPERSPVGTAAERRRRRRRADGGAGCGRGDHNRQRPLALGATGSVIVSGTISTLLSYTDEVSRNHTGVSGVSRRGHTS